MVSAKRGNPPLKVPVELHIILSRTKGEAVMKEIHELTSVEGLTCSCQALNSSLTLPILTFDIFVKKIHSGPKFIT